MSLSKTTPIWLPANEGVGVTAQFTIEVSQRMRRLSEWMQSGYGEA